MGGWAAVVEGTIGRPGSSLGRGSFMGHQEGESGGGRRDKVERSGRRPLRRP